MMLRLKSHLSFKAMQCFTHQKNNHIQLKRHLTILEYAIYKIKLIIKGVSVNLYTYICILMVISIDQDINRVAFIGLITRLFNFFDALTALIK